MSDTKRVHVRCPICSENFYIFIEAKIISEAKKYPVAFVLEHNNHTLIAYIDSNFIVRGVKSVLNLKGNLAPVMSQLDKNERSSAYGLLENMSLEERTIFYCQSGCEEFQKSNIPNVLDKQILNLILKHKEISLAKMLSNLSILEKALNRKIDERTILQILDKYMKQGLIIRHVMKTDKEFKSSNSFSSQLPQGGEL
jgi:hypothetical protein